MKQDRFCELDRALYMMAWGFALHAKWTFRRLIDGAKFSSWCSDTAQALKQARFCRAMEPHSSTSKSCLYTWTCCSYGNACIGEHYHGAQEQTHGHYASFPACHIAGCEDLKRLPASTLSVRGVPWHAHAHPSGSRFAEAGRAGRTLGCESERANRTPSTPLLRGSGMLITIRCWWSLYGGLRLHDVIVIWWPRAYLLVF